MKKKINVGSGLSWKFKNWETLDNGSGKYKEKWQHKGKCWDTKLLSNTYDVVFTSHMLEHIPHFRLEKTISEFNRILKTNGVLRIVVPDLEKVTKAYVNKNKNFFTKSVHYTDHLGIGGSFVSKLISPGKNTLAISREMDEIFGGYAHIYHFDYEMLKILLKKWGFGKIRNPRFSESIDEDMCNELSVKVNEKVYSMNSNYVREKKFLNEKNWYHSGFDKSKDVSLIVECVKLKNEKYSIDKEYKYNKRNRFGDNLEDKIKLFIIRLIFTFTDIIFSFLKKIKNFFRL